MQIPCQVGFESGTPIDDQLHHTLAHYDASSNKQGKTLPRKYLPLCALSIWTLFATWWLLLSATHKIHYPFSCVDGNGNARQATARLPPPRDTFCATGPSEAIASPACRSRLARTSWDTFATMEPSFASLRMTLMACLRIRPSEAPRQQPYLAPEGFESGATSSLWNFTETILEMPCFSIVTP